jgi:hypothetical protein
MDIGCMFFCLLWLLKDKQKVGGIIKLENNTSETNKNLHDKKIEHINWERTWIYSISIWSPSSWSQDGGF